MPWRDEDSRSLLLELWMLGSARRRVRQGRLIEHLARAGWVHASTRASEVELVESHLGDLTTMLDSAWEEWRSVVQALMAEELPPTVAGLRKLRRRQCELPPLPARLSLRTATALVAEHSKAALGAEHLAMLGDTRVMRDGAALIRPNDGLALVRAGVTYRADEIAEVQGVLAITQRALADGTHFGGQLPVVVMTVENLGAFVDMPKPAWMMLVHVPGWNVPLAVEAIRALGAARVLHFGDLDPNGIRIFEVLRDRLGGVELWVPEQWRGVLENAPVRVCDWPEGLLQESHPALLHELAATGRWAEQERVAVAEGIDLALQALRERGSPNPTGA